MDDTDPEARITIAKFKKKEDADYALLQLNSFLDMDKRIWSPRNAPILSEVWYQVKQKLSDDRNILALTKNAILKVTGPDEITIEYPVICDDWNSDLQKYQDKVYAKLKGTLGVTSPVKFLKWKPSKDIKLG